MLPTLGEVGVALVTLEELLGVHIGATGLDSAAAAWVKHDIRMAEVLRRALAGRMRRPTGLVSGDRSHVGGFVGTAEVRS